MRLSLFVIAGICAFVARLTSGCRRQRAEAVVRHRSQHGISYRPNSGGSLRRMKGLEVMEQDAGKHARIRGLSRPGEIRSTQRLASLPPMKRRRSFPSRWRMAAWVSSSKA